MKASFLLSKIAKARWYHGISPVLGNNESYFQRRDFLFEKIMKGLEQIIYGKNYESKWPQFVNNEVAVSVANGYLNREALEEVIKKVQEHTAVASLVVVEAAHIYADQQPCAEQAVSASIAAEIGFNLGKPMHRMLLVDDYHPMAKTLELDSYIDWLSGQGYSTDEVIMESSLVQDAQELLEQIKQSVPKKKIALSKGDGWKPSLGLGLWTRMGKIPLLTSYGRPSCELLDAALYLKKSQLSETCLTILPNHYISEQSRTQAILGSIGHRISLVNIYFDPQVSGYNPTVNYFQGKGVG